MKLICDGCNVNPPHEHRCHRALAIVRGEPTGKRCECLDCNADAQKTEPLDLERIRAYCAKATAEPWEIGHADIPDDWNLGERVCAGGKVVAATIEPEYSNDPLAITREQGKAIATFIASARTDLPAAIAEIERLRVEVATLTHRLSFNEQLREAIRNEECK